jgi:RNA polymerase sigma-70 factor (ECF subfamily)
MTADRTSASLLGRLRQDAADQVAWGEFVRRYGPLVYGWSRKWGLQEADAQDVTQTVLVKLAEKLRSFDYDAGRSFRAYLKTLTRYAWCDLLETRKRPGAGSGDSAVLERLGAVEAREELVAQLNLAFDRELLEMAMARVQQRVEAHTWEAFCLTALEGLSGAEVAGRLGMKEATVFKSRSRVQKLLQEEIDQLDR